MGSTRNRPSNVVNTPMGPRRKGRIAGERMREDQARRPFFAPPKDLKRRKRLSGEESRDVFGQDFSESVKETERREPERRQTTFFGRKISAPTPKPSINRRGGFSPMRQVTKIDEFGQKYGGLEKYNPETGKYEAQYTKPPRPTRNTPLGQQEGRPRGQRERRPLYGPMSDADRKKMEDKGLRRM